MNVTSSLVIMFQLQSQLAEANSIAHPIPATVLVSRGTQTSVANGEHNDTTIGSLAIDTNALAYLQKYGYMMSLTDHNNPTKNSNNLISEESFSQAITSFQRFAGLPETGEFSNDCCSWIVS